MAQVAPFRALHYNPAKIPHPEEVVTPPYDVIRPEEREAFAALNPYNMVRLILPQPQPGDDLLQNRYTRAAATFRQWQQEGVLVRDPEPAYYYGETEFVVQGRKFTRTGLVALVRLEPFSSGVIRPHEQTFSAPKKDRLELLKATQAHFSPIFAIFPDPENLVLGRLRQSLPPAPMLAFEDSEGYYQRAYRVTDPACLVAVHGAFEKMPLFIADGHHRYETALNYQKLMKERYPQAGANAPFNYVLMYLANIFDPELVILMAHRLLAGPKVKQVEEGPLFRRLAEYFAVTPLPYSGGGDGPGVELLQENLAATAAQETTFILLGFGLKAWRLLLRPGVRQKLLAREMHPALAQLDVAVLNYLIFEKILGLDAKALDDQQTCKFTSKIPEVISILKRGEANLAFLLNPTRVDQVQQVASAGLIMPRKSTYFYPKVKDGIVLCPINPGEEVIVP
ncbi:MAG: DUF1015 domain-containing protein [Thermodesulfobacteriota bacterium]